jgi:hypothetical protein
MKLFRTIAVVASLSIPFVAHAATINGVDWRQPVNYTGISADELDSLCDASTGRCHGSINGKALDGLVWASLFEVRSMLTVLIPGIAGVTPSDPNSPGFDYEFHHSDTIDHAIGDGALAFLPTGIDTIGESVSAYTRTALSSGNFPNGQFIANLRDLWDPGSVNSDFANSLFVTDGSYKSATLGNWFYVDPAPVPLPAAVWLLLSGVGGLAALARRRRLE